MSNCVYLCWKERSVVKTSRKASRSHRPAWQVSPACETQRTTQHSVCWLTSFIFWRIWLQYDVICFYSIDMKIWIRTMPSYSYETTMTTTSSSSSSSSRAKSESRCSSVSSKVGLWHLEEMQEEQFQIQKQIWHQTASKDSVDFFSPKAGWGVLLWTEPLRWGEAAAGKVHGKDFLRVYELFLWFIPV